MSFSQKIMTERVIVLSMRQRLSYLLYYRVRRVNHSFEVLNKFFSQNNLWQESFIVILFKYGVLDVSKS